MRTIPAKRSGLQLTPRDMKLLFNLESWRVLGLGQLVGLGMSDRLIRAELVERFFNKIAREDYDLGVPKRLVALEAAGFIKAHYFQRQPKAYTLTFRGITAVKGGPRHGAERDYVSEAIIDHELTVGAVGLVLNEILGLTASRETAKAIWTTPAHKRHLTVQNAADLWISTPPMGVAVEVELTQKSAKRYGEIFESYRRRLGRNEVLLYLTGWPNGSDTILRRARDHRAPFVYACSLEEFRAACGRSTFRGAVQGRAVTLGSYPFQSGLGQ